VLNQHGRFDGSLWNVQHLLCADKNVIPKAGLQVVLQLGQIQVNT
jgi:hypothetical protein